MNESYNIYEVMHNNNDLFITENEKFWVRADYYNGQTGEADKAYTYILTDAYLHIYKVLHIDSGFVTAISENILVMRDSNNSRHYHIIDGDGNDISSKYVNESEIILGVFDTDNGMNIFTVSTEDTYSTQNVIFKVYDGNKNCKLSFSKQDINDKYGFEIHCSTDTLGISNLGNNIYCVYTMSGSVIDYDIYVSNAADESKEMGLYIDLNSEKFFLAGKGGHASDGKYIWCEGRLMTVDSYIDIENETTNFLMDSLKYKDTYTHRVSSIWNGKFITNTQNGPLDSSNYAIHNCQGNLVCDLDSGINVTNCNGFYDGYALMEIEGGTKYITVINENGEWQFEPIQGNILWHQYIQSTGQFVAVKNDYSGLILINKFGEQEEVPISIAQDIRYDQLIITQIDGGIQYILCNGRGHTLYRKEVAETDNNLSQKDFIIDWKDKNLEEAMQQITGITDRDIMLSDVIGIEELNLCFTEVENIDSLKYLTNLKDLKLRSGKYLPDGTSMSELKNDDPLDLSALSHLTKLKNLRLEGKKIKNIEALANLQNLEILSFCGAGGIFMFPTMISDISPLAGLSNLKILNMPSTQVTNIEPLANLENLERLDLSYNNITDISPLSNLNQLTCLKLNSTNVTDINSLSNLSQLVTLDLGNTNITYIEPLTSLIYLEDLNLYNTNIANLKVLTNLPRLTSLSLGNATINDFDAIKNLKNLTSLDLHKTGISNITFLQNLTRLENLYLSDNSITDISLLSSFTNLKYLDLTGNPISDYSPVSFVENLYKD